MVPIFVLCLAHAFDGERWTSWSRLKRANWLVLTVSNKSGFSPRPCRGFYSSLCNRHPYIPRRHARRVSIDFYGTFHSSFFSPFFPSPFSTAGSVALAIITPRLRLESLFSRRSSRYHHPANFSPLSSVYNT